MHDMRCRLLEKYSDVFCDELGKDDRINEELIKREVKMEGVKPFHCWTMVNINANFDHVAKRTIHSMIEAGILEEVDYAANWCARRFFCVKTDSGGKLCLVTDYQALNESFRQPV